MTAAMQTRIKGIRKYWDLFTKKPPARAVRTGGNASIPVSTSHAKRKVTVTPGINASIVQSSSRERRPSTQGCISQPRARTVQLVLQYVLQHTCRDCIRGAFPG